MKIDFSGIEALLCANHCHTPVSNQSENNYGNDNYNDNHILDPLYIRDELPAEFCLVYEATEHYVPGKTVPEIADRIEKERDGEVEIYDSYVIGKYRESGEELVTVLVPGVESATDWAEKSHICHTFLPVNYEKSHFRSSTEEINDLSEIAGLNRVAHPAAPNNSTPEHELREYVDEGNNRGFVTDIAATYGYAPFFNQLAQGKFNFVAAAIDDDAEYTKPVEELCNELEVKAQPEIDLHTFVPENGFGFGFIDGSQTLEKLYAEGEPPIEDFRDQKVVGNKGLKAKISRLRDAGRFFQAYPSLPGINLFYSADEEAWEDDLQESISTLSGLEIEDTRNLARELP